MKTKSLLIPIIALSATSGTVLADHHMEAENKEKMVKPADDAATDATDKKDIVEIASGAEDFSTLVAAIEAAGLSETLKGDGPFTVFAPSNAAFEALPEGLVVKLMEPANKEKLKSILMYHVIPSKVMAADVAPMKVATAGGAEATVTMDGETVMIDAAKVVKTDVVASNGVIHVIDKVLMPPPVDEEKTEE